MLAKIKLLVLMASIASLLIILLMSRHLQPHAAAHRSTGATAAYDGCSPMRSGNETHQFEVMLDGVRYPRVVPAHFNKSLDFECLNRAPLRRIFLWNRFWKSDTFEFGLGERTPFVEHRCPVANCEVTRDPLKFNTSDLVLVHGYDLLRRDASKQQQQRRRKANGGDVDSRLPAHRASGQRWVFTYFESPVSTELLCYKNLANKFDMLNTYHSAADFDSIYYANAHFEWKTNTSFNLSFDYHATKTKFAAALISDCKTSSARGPLIDRLRKFVSVDVYGKCGTSTCPPNGADCRAHIASQYKFFMAFENSLCSEYVTEKFFRTLNYDIVPVVLGYGDYARFVPTSAFINAIEFNSPRLLAQHLLHIDSQPALYNKFFAWRQHITYHRERWPHTLLPAGAPLTATFHTFCDMCIRMQLDAALYASSVQEEKEETRQARQKSNKIEQLFDTSNCNLLKFDRRHDDRFMLVSFLYGKSKWFCRT